MFLPQFSIRQILAIVAVCACFFLVLSQAVRGSYWAMGVVVGIASLLAVMLMHAILFNGLWLFSVVWRRGVGFTPDKTNEVVAKGSPFAPIIANPASAAAMTSDHARTNHVP